MKIGELRLILDRLQQLYISAGAKGPAKDLKALYDLLGPHADRPVNAFVVEIRNGLSQAPEKSKGRKKASEVSKSPRLNEAAIDYHIVQLRNAGNDSDIFNEALDALKADKSVTLLDLTEIGRQYSGSSTKYKSVLVAHKDISKAFVRQARFANKLR